MEVIKVNASEIKVGMIITDGRFKYRVLRPAEWPSGYNFGFAPGRTKFLVESIEDVVIRLPDDHYQRILALAAEHNLPFDIAQEHTIPKGHQCNIDIRDIWNRFTIIEEANEQ
jgi:hypothetical protein